MNNSIVTISNIKISQDKLGRYCLNDLHKASGSDQKHRPKYWLENKQTIDLIDLLNKDIYSGEIPPILAKQGLGTFVAKELVYAYAMWISPSFHLAVIRAYDALVTQPILNLTDFQVDQIVKQLSLKLGDSLRFGVRRNWTAMEDKTAMELRKSGYGMTRIGYALGRSAGSVKGRFDNKLKAKMAADTRQADLFFEV